MTEKRIQWILDFIPEFNKTLMRQFCGQRHHPLAGRSDTLATPVVTRKMATLHGRTVLLWRSGGCLRQRHCYDNERLLWQGR